MAQPLISLEEAVEAAKATTTGTIILTDAADATSSGASGDSSAIVAALVAGGYRGSVLAPIVDAPAVEAAIAAGVGNRITTTIGGRSDPARFTPMPFDGFVARARGRAVRERIGRPRVPRGPDRGPQERVPHVRRDEPAGDAPRPIAVPRLWPGPDPFDAVVVKSPRCEPHLFDAWAARTVHIDAPGSTSANLRSLGHSSLPAADLPAR